MSYEFARINPPDEWFEEQPFHELFECEGCGQRESAFLSIHFDEKFNENRCKECIESKDTQSDLGLNDYRFQQYIDKTLKQPPRCK